MGCITIGRPDPKRIEAVFPLLERLHVRAFRDQGWCRNIAYDRGAFSETRNHGTCDLFEDVPREFDPTASADFDTVKRSLRDAGVSPDYVNVQFADGRVRQVELAVSGGSLVYEAGGVAADSGDGAPERLSENWEWYEGD